MTRKFIQDRTARIGIMGLGHVGIELALLFSRSGFVVEGFDLGPIILQTPESRRYHLRQIPSEPATRTRGGAFNITSDLSQLSETDVIIICIPSACCDRQEPDLRSIRETTFSVASNLHSGHLVVLESTTYPGATEEVIVPILESANCAHLKFSRNTGAPNEVFVGVSPGREIENADIDRRDVAKIVGGVDRLASELTAALYGTVFRKVVPVSTPATAEMATLLESVYQSVNIALVNELKQICLRMGIDLWEAIDAASTNPIGFQAFYPGPGVGDHGTLFAPFHLSWKASASGCRARLVELASEINEDMPEFVVRCIVDALNRLGRPLKDARILVLGVWCEKEIGDLFESPSVHIIELLLRAGAVVDYNDPFVPHIRHERPYDLNMSSVHIDDVSRYDAVLIAADHSVYDYRGIVSEGRLVIDTRNATKGIESDKIVRC